MSLYEYSMLAVIKNVRKGKIHVSEDNLPEDVYNELTGYLSNTVIKSIQKSILFNRFVICDHFIKVFNYSIKNEIKSLDVEIIPYDDNFKTLIDFMLGVASSKGNLVAIQYLINKGANDWDNGLQGAVHNNDLSLIDFFIEKGAKSWNIGMYEAAYRDNKELVDFFIEKGANRWCIGLSRALRSRDKKLVAFFETKPIQDYSYALMSCIKIRDHKLIILYCKKIPNAKPLTRNLLSLPKRNNDYETIKVILDNLTIPITIQITRLGEVLIKLINNINFEIEPKFALTMMRSGLVFTDALLILFKLYIKQHNLRVKDGFKLDTALYDIFSLIPSIYKIDYSKRSGISPNTSQLTTMEILNLSHNLITTSEVFKILKINNFEPEYVTDHNLIADVYKEYLLIRSL